MESVLKWELQRPDQRAESIAYMLDSCGFKSERDGAKIIAIAHLVVRRSYGSATITQRTDMTGWPPKKVMQWLGLIGKG